MRDHLIHSPELIALGNAIEARHGGEVIYMGCKPVTVSNGDVILVHSFVLVCNPRARFAYAWFADKERKQDIRTALELPPVASPEDAVLADVVARL